MPESVTARWVRRSWLALLALVVGLPLLVLVSTSLKPLADVTDTFHWGQRVTFRPWLDMWSSVPLGQYLLNSVVVSVVTTGLTIAIAVPAAYTLARTRLRGRRALLFALLVVQAVPGLVVLVPVFLLYAQAGTWLHVELIGSRTGLLLVDLTMALPFAVWLLTGQLATTSLELEDAARVDGASTPSVLLHVVIPGLAPTIRATAALTFVLVWGEVLFASVLMGGPSQTLPVGLHAFATMNGVRWNELAAAGLLSAAPIVLILSVARPLRSLVEDAA